MMSQQFAKKEIPAGNAKIAELRMKIASTKEKQMSGFALQDNQLS